MYAFVAVPCAKLARPYDKSLPPLQKFEPKAHYIDQEQELRRRTSRSRTRRGALMTSFIKFLTPDQYLHNLFIPRAFMARLSGEEMKVATLTSCKGSGNQSWLVGLRKDDEGVAHITLKNKVGLNL